MTYKKSDQDRPITVVEMPLFSRAADSIWTEDERAGLIDYIAYHPEAGAVIPGTGGVRKLRWGRAGSGKRGGARVVYFFHDADCPLYMLLAYTKSDTTDLSPTEKKTVTAIAMALRDAHRGGKAS